MCNITAAQPISRILQSKLEWFSYFSSSGKSISLQVHRFKRIILCIFTYPNSHALYTYTHETWMLFKQSYFSLLTPCRKHNMMSRDSTWRCLYFESSKVNLFLSSCGQSDCLMVPMYHPFLLRAQPQIRFNT